MLAPIVGLNVRAVSVLGKNLMRFAVFWRISVRFCGFRTPLTPPSYSKNNKIVPNGHLPEDRRLELANSLLFCRYTGALRRLTRRRLASQIRRLAVLVMALEV